MEQLPDELILNIISFLEASDVLPLNLISKRFLKISRDNEFWKDLCFQGSPVPSRSVRHREGRYGGPIPIQEPRVFELQRAVRRSTGSSNYQDNDAAGGSLHSQASASTGHKTWDPTYTADKFDWYNEYIARHAPLFMSWLPQPRPTDNASRGCDIRGMGLLKKDGDDILVMPMEDGSVCLWDIGRDIVRPSPRSRQFRSCSNSGILFSSTQKQAAQTHISCDNAVECVSIDQFSQRAYFAAHSTLTEIDLNTLQATSQQPFTEQICSLSEGGIHPNPLTIGTIKSVHIYDPRDPSSISSPSASSSLTENLNSIDPPRSNSPPDFHRLYSSDLPTPETLSFAPIDPLPLSIIHLSHSIHVGGRFPSILSYDRRFFPQKMTSMHSGARISALTSLTTLDNTQHTLVAAGEYKGKGSLELYPLSNNERSPDPDPLPSPIKNRATASRSKLLSIIPHGARLLFSDSDGQLKWVERDGSTLVRRWNINNWSVYSSPEARSSIFNAGADEGEVARKLLAVDNGERSEVLVWTGEKVGLVGYGSEGRFREGAKKEKKGDSNGDEGTADWQERKYGRMMRQALERQADEVRFVKGLGLGW